MENEMRGTQLSIPGKAKEDEEDQENTRPINRKEFREAIQSLQTLINNLSDQINIDGKFSGEADRYMDDELENEELLEGRNGAWINNMSEAEGQDVKNWLLENQ
eukprot:15375543-Heterocapsa_arctica.AAC.1